MSRCLIALALVTGQIGRPGTGLHPLRGQNNVQGASDAGLIPMVYPDYQSVERPEIRGIFEAAWGRALDPQRGLTVVEIMHAIHAGDDPRHVYRGRKSRRCPIPTSTMRARRWRNSSISSCRICS